MKNLFFVSVAFSIFSGTSFTAQAQRLLNFNDGIDLASEARTATSATVHFTSGNDEMLPSGSEITPLQLKYSHILKRGGETVTNAALYKFINDWYGTRYRYGGTSKKGIDCSSLMGRMMKAVYSINLPRTARQQYAVCLKIPQDQMTEGDLVFFNTRGGISHVGLFLGEGYFVHASSSSGVIISQIDDTYYKYRFIGAGRINTIDYTKILL